MLRVLAGAVTELLEIEERDGEQRRERLARFDAMYAAGGPTPVFQPIVELAGLRVVGVEALSRFPAGTPDPQRWFTTAAGLGVAEELELTAMRRALRVLSGLPLHRLVLELTEHEKITDYGRLVACLAPLRRAGLWVAVDDAGAGFASMRHVLALLPDLIKLDVSLVRDIPVADLAAAGVARSHDHGVGGDLACRGSRQRGLRRYGG